MPVIELDKDNFDTIALGGGVVLVDCWATWCRGCKDFDPIFEAAAERHPTHTFAKVDTGAEGELTKKLSVSHVPTLILFRDGILLLRQPGHVPAEALDEIVEKAAALDMDHVRETLESESAESPA